LFDGFLDPDSRGGEGEMVGDKAVQKRVFPELRRSDKGVLSRMLGILFLLIGSGVVVWNVMLAVSERNVGRLLYALIGLFFIYGGTWAIGVDLREWLFALLHRRAWRRLQVSAEAEIVDRKAKKHQDSYGNVHYTYWVTFRFASTEGPVTLEGRVDKPQYDRLQRADTVMVRYALENPCIALLEGEWED
jgi:hypothetical protein